LAKHNDKGNLLEDIVASFHNDENLRVETRVKIKKREIDVLITTNPLGYDDIKIPIECKNQVNKVGSSQIDSFIGKLHGIGLATQNAIFVSVNGYTSGAKESAKKAGIKLLTVQGLTKDRLAKSIYKAIQSVIYILPIYQGYKVISSIENASNNEHLIFYDKNKKYKGTLADIIYDNWKADEVPLSLGAYKVRIEVPDGWFNLYNNELHMCFPTTVELMFVGYVFSYYGNASRLLLIDDETQEVKKDNINLAFENCEKCTIKSFESEDELKVFLNNRNESYKLDISRVKLPKVRMQDLFYPLSKKVYNEFQTFYNNTNRSKLEIEQFSQKIQEMEKDIFSIWD